MRITFRQTLHPVGTYALRLTFRDKTLVYSADTGRDESLAQFAGGAGLFVCEATWGAGESIATNIHLTGEEAGRLASLAGAQKLLLTHLAEAKAQETVRAARKEYGGPVEYARAGRTFRV